MFPSAARPNFTDFVHGLCQAQGFTPQVVQEVGDAVTGVALVASGFGVCIIRSRSPISARPASSTFP